MALGDGFEVALGWLSLGYQQQLAIASSGQRLETPASDATDLGMLELPDGIAARFDLGGGTNCVVTPTALADGNAKMQITVEVTNADGTASQLGTSLLTARPGQHCSISVGDRMIALAVKLKTQSQGPTNFTGN